MAAQIPNLVYPEHPWATLLLQEQTRFKQFVNTLPRSSGQQNTLLEVLTMEAAPGHGV